VHGWTKERGLREFRRELYKRDLYYLEKFVLGYDKMRFHLHYPLCLSASELPPRFMGLWELPRGHYKTTCLTIGPAVQSVLRDPNTAILFMSNVDENASAKMGEARSLFSYCDELKRWFPEHEPKTVAQRGNSEGWNSPARRTGRAESTFEVAGADTRKVGKHYDEIAMDDLWDSKSVTSPGVAQRTLDLLDAAKYLLRADGPIKVVGTRWSFDDPTETLVKDGRVQAVIVSAVRKDGEALFPEFKPLPVLFEEWRSHPYNFSCQMMLNPTLEDRSFRKEWFRYVKVAEVLRLESEGQLATTRVLLTDAQGTGARSTDWNAALVVLADSLGRYTVAEYYHEKSQPNEFIDVCFALADKWSCRMVACQKAPLESSLQSFIQERRKARLEKGQRAVNWYPVSLAKTAKTDRMQALQPYFAAGRVYFAEEDMEAQQELEQEILQFPMNMSADDGMDALSMLTDPVVGKVPRAGVAPPADLGENDPAKPVTNLQQQQKMENDWRKQRQREYMDGLSKEAKTGGGGMVR